MDTTTTTTALAAAPVLDAGTGCTTADIDAQLKALAQRRRTLADRLASIDTHLAGEREAAAMALADGAELPASTGAARAALAQERDDVAAALARVDAKAQQLSEARRPVERAEHEARLAQLSAEGVAHAETFNREVAAVADRLLAIADAYGATWARVKRARGDVERAGGEVPWKRAEEEAWHGPGNPARLVSFLREYRAHYAALLARDDASAAR